MVQTVKTPTETSNLFEGWFDEFVASIRADQIQLETFIATKEKKEFYDLMISGSQNEIMHLARNASSIQFIKNIIFEYIHELNVRQCKPTKLAFNLSDAKVLVWAEIEDNDENTEDNLLLAEAKVNADYYKFGFHISSTILENSDHYPVPSQYKPVN